MTDKEHLKDVKELINKYENGYDKDTALKYAVDLMRNHARYFIEQAERVQELEKERSEWKDTAQSYYMTNQELREQNKRYREALDKQFKEFWEACVKVVGEDMAYDIVAEMPEEGEE